MLRQVLTRGFPAKSGTQQLAHGFPKMAGRGYCWPVVCRGEGGGPRGSHSTDTWGVLPKPLGYAINQDSSCSLAGGPWLLGMTFREVWNNM